MNSFDSYQLQSLWNLPNPHSMVSFQDSLFSSEKTLNSIVSTENLFSSFKQNDSDSLLLYDYNSTGTLTSSNSTSPLSFEHVENLETTSSLESLDIEIEKTIPQESSLGATSQLDNQLSTFQIPTMKRLSILEQRQQRVNNYCETVAVESSGHVAQIVGKNGCKIKHLRAKYGTYIHTPSANDEPVFIIKGPRDKVLEVKQEIIKADNHFSAIRDQRNTKIAKMIDSQDATCIRLFIPSKYIGLVVGRNGWFVKDLQSNYNIYIETPKFEICNYFQLYGPRDRLNIAKQLIFEHILKKTGINFMERYDKETDSVYFVESIPF